jgi:hypothetical protein
MEVAEAMVGAGTFRGACLRIRPDAPRALAEGQL